MGSGRVSTCIGLVAVLAVLALAPAARAQPIRRVTALDEPFAGPALPTDATMAPAAPISPRTAYQPPPRDPGADPNEPDFLLPDGTPLAVPQSKSREFRLGRRYGTKVDLDEIRLPDGSKRFLLVGGWVVNAASFDGQEATEFAADQIVIWTRGQNTDNVRQGGGFTTDGDGKSEVEFYMSGNVIIRSTSGTGVGKTTETVRAAEVYYDAQRNKAIAVRADLEMLNPRSVDPIHLRGDEIQRLDLENWVILCGKLSASKLPSDPGLYLESERFTLNARRVVRRNIFNMPYRSLDTGEEVESVEKIITGRNVTTRLDGVPVFFTPDMQTNANSPLGPVRGFTAGVNRQFGNGVYTTYDLFDLLALVPPPTDKWRLNLDYMSKRGVGYGSDLYYFVADPEAAKNPPGAPLPPSIGSGVVTAYAISDKGYDLLAYRGDEPNHPDFRGRFTWRDQRELGDEFYNQSQISYLSDYNFLEQYYPNEFLMGPNQETFEYLAWQRRNFGANVLVEDKANQYWTSETNSLPMVKGELIGQTFLDDLFVYSAKASAGYLQSRPAKPTVDYPYPAPLLGTDVSANSGRFDLWQELNVPLSLGPVKVAPYGILELTDYTADINGNETGRVYGAGGVRASLPFSRLYDDVSSELLNLRGLYHKVNFDIDYRYARTNVPYTQLPMFDRLDDDSTDQGYRNFTPLQSAYVAGPAGVALQNGPGYSPYNPQLYAIRRVVEGDIDTLDNIDVLQMDVRQRFQTKRGYPGAEHTVDFLTFDLSASYFPEAGRDNFGHPFAFLEYATTWNVGDRTAIVSNGWFEPYQNGSRYWNIGAYLNRTDRTGFYLGYRQTDPLNSKEVSMNLTYQLSHQYYLSIGANYDFGLGQALSNSLTLTRTGTDLTVTLGFTYTAFVNSFGFQFLVVPNLALMSGLNANPQAVAPKR